MRRRSNHWFLSTLALAGWLGLPIAADDVRAEDAGETISAGIGLPTRREPPLPERAMGAVVSPLAAPPGVLAHEWQRPIDPTGGRAMMAAQMQAAQVQAFQAQAAQPMEPVAPGYLQDQPIYVQDPQYALPSLAPQQQDGVWSAGGAVYILRPSGQTTAYETTNGVGTSSVSQTSSNFTWDYAPAPAVWVGYTTPNGLKTFVRFFYYDQFSDNPLTSLDTTAAASTTISAPSSLPSSPAAGITFSAPGTLSQASAGIIGAGGAVGPDMLSFSSHLRINVVDWEAAFYETQVRGNWFRLTGGARYLYLSQSYSGTLTNSATDILGNVATETDTINFAHNFSGGGVTFGTRALRYLPWRGWSFFGNFRGSLIVGQTHQTYAVNKNLNDPASVAGGSSSSSASSDNTFDLAMPVLDAETGLSYDLVIGRRLVTTQAAIVDQTYFNAGTASSLGGNLSLFGLRFSTQVSF
jgi:hypothetical protein